MALLKGWGPGHVDFALDRETVVRLSAQDLYDCAPVRFDPETGQRLAPLQDAPAELAILERRRDRSRLARRVRRPGRHGFSI